MPLQVGNDHNKWLVWHTPLDAPTTCMHEVLQDCSCQCCKHHTVDKGGAGLSTRWMQGKPWTVIECVVKLRLRCVGASKQGATIVVEELAHELADLRAATFATIQLKGQDIAEVRVQPCREWSVLRVPQGVHAHSAWANQHGRVCVHLLHRRRSFHMGCLFADPWRTGPSGPGPGDDLMRVASKDNSLHSLVSGSRGTDTCHDLVELI